MSTRLKVTLRDVHPAVTRVLDVPASTTLPELHDLLQVALGWTDSHLHEFVAGDQRWAVPSEDSGDEEELDESTASLKDLPASFVYHYDFGDSWEHDVEVLGPGGEPGLVESEGACPPEDSGGPFGYEHKLAALGDRKHPEHEDVVEWMGGAALTHDHDRLAARVQRVLT